MAEITAADFTIVIATYNRGESLRLILDNLANQSVLSTSPKSSRLAFAVIVVDDGSTRPATDFVTVEGVPFPLHVERQTNAGAAAARQRGADLAKTRFVVFIDDDMIVPPEFLAEHLKAHAAEPDHDCVVMGRLQAAPNLERMPLFERFHARMHDRIADDAKSGRLNLRGPGLYSGNVSMPRELFFRCGGFDPAFAQIEDAELGVRLEQAGGKFVFSYDAYTVHASDHTSKAKWLARSVRDGLYWSRLAKKHPRDLHANPWRFLTSVNPLSRPVLTFVVAAPKVAPVLGEGIVSAAELVDKLGLHRLAVGATTLAYGVQYFQGVRNEAGSLRDAIREYRAFLAATREAFAAAKTDRDLLAAVAADHAFLLQTQGKYGDKDKQQSALQPQDVKSLAVDAVNNIGFQLLIGYRIMRFLRARGDIFAAKFCSRVLRHVYGSDIHWDAEFEPGIVLVHGFGLAINGGVHVSAGCILFQHVTLGRSIHPDSRESGAPYLEPDVHVGVGATLVGPIRIGARSKLAPSVTVVRDIPADSVVESSPANVKPREKNKTKVAAS
jgi:serine acetyltransferase/GT2 family glycosyltransferase